MYETAALSLTPNRLANSAGPISRMYSDNRTGQSQHETCSERKGARHVLFSDHGRRGPHNSCVAGRRKKDDKHDPIAAEMGRRLADCRKRMNWTQAALAEQTGWKPEDADAGTAQGVAPSAIGNYEQGTRRIGNEQAEIFGRIFGLPSAYFMVVVDEHEAEIIIALRKRAPTPPGSSTRRRQPA